MKIFVTGTRGIPEIPGGVEKHCEQLYPLIVESGHRVRLSRRSLYVSKAIKEWSGIELVDNFAPRMKSFEAFVHTLLAVFEAKQWGADIVHIHAVGPALLAPIARLLGLKVVFTDHGPDYDRDKWGTLARYVLRVGEKMGGVFANEVIVISGVIKNIIKVRCKRDSHLIYNGVRIPQKTESTSFVESNGLEVGGYILAVARFVPEKGLHDLIEAYNQSGLEYKLVLVGDSDYQDIYSSRLKRVAKKNPNIVLTGYIFGKKLQEVFSHARLFVLPSYHEGLPIALLEALSYGLIPLVSDISANKEVLVDSDFYFRCKDVEHLREKLIQLSHREFSQKDRKQIIEFVRDKYNWEIIANQTIEVYEAALKS